MRKPIAWMCGVAMLLSGGVGSAQQGTPGYATVRSGGAGPAGAIPEPAGGGLGSMPAGMSSVRPTSGDAAVPAANGPSSGAATIGPSPMAVLSSYVMDPPSPFGTETVWVSGGYLMGWFTRPKLVTPLITQGDTADPRPGALGQPGTRVLYGDDQFRFGNLHGMTAELGVNLNDRIYVDFRGFVFWPQHTRYTQSSDPNGAPFRGRPVFDVFTGSEGGYRVSNPGVIVGSATIDARQQLFGYEVNGRYNVKLTPYLDVDALIGYRRVQLEEDLRITDRLQLLIPGAISFSGAPLSAGDIVLSLDRFRTINQFNGVNLGGRFRWQSGYDWLAFTGYYKVALGQTIQSLKIEGLSFAETSNGLFAEVGGILAQRTNIGTHRRREFGVIPELGASIVFLPAPNIRLHAGYSAMFWNNVIRPTGCIDRRVDPALPPTSNQFGIPVTVPLPGVVFKSESVWLQSINFALELYY